MAGFDPAAAEAEVRGGIADELAAAGFTGAREVGHGGFGTVYRCEQPDLGRTVAVKVLSAVLDEDNYERFRREEFVMGRLSGHPNIATILQTGSLTVGRPYIVMPFYPGGSLDSLVRREGPCDWQRAVRVGIKLAGALETAHRAGILHRDVKPANILLTEYAEPQLTDFGIARIAGGFETGTGNVAGSLAFTAPEVLGGASPSVVGDVYSLGATLFNLVAGKPAFERRPGEELVAQFLRIMRQETPEPDAPGVPDDVHAVIKAAMAREPAARPESAAVLGERLRGLLSGHGLVPNEMAVPAAGRAPDAVQPVPAGGREAGGGATQLGPIDAGESGPMLPVRHRLPVALTSFVGRDREVREVTALLGGDARLVTLTGPGGVGKTRLALQVATRLEPSLAGGVWTVDLGNVLEADQLTDVIADALDLSDGREPARNTIQNLGRRLAKSLGTRRVLIVLENCEHLIAQCGPLIEHLLRVLPGLQLLVTSRQVLGIAGEHIYAVPPLAFPGPAEIGDDPAALDRLMHNPAIELFVDRAHAVVPGFTMTDEDRLNVARLCGQLDGIPLVIELAAARLRTYGVTELLQIIEDRFRLLTGSNTAQPRHRTLQALVDWSYQLLTDDEREVWLAAALFAGDFSADAVVEVCTGPTRSAQDVRVILASLVDKSMVASTPQDGLHRYRLLVTLREYAAQRLMESGSRDDVVDRYVNRYRRLADEFRRDWFGPRQVEVFTAVHDERENLRAALTYCQADGVLSHTGAAIVVALHYYWLASTTLTEGRRWLAEAIDIADLDLPTRARMLWSAAILAFLQNDVDALRRHAGAASEVAQECGDHCCEGYAHLALGFVALTEHDLAGGLSEHRKALACERAADDAEGLVAVASGLISALGEDSAVEDAGQLWAEAVRLCEQAGDRWHLAYLMYVHGYHRYRLGDYEAAWSAELESLRLSEPFADRVVVAYALETMSWIAVRRNDFENAAQMAGAAAASWASDHASITGVLAHQRRETDALMRSALGEQRAAELIGEGKAIGADVVVAVALSAAVAESDDRPGPT